MIGCLGAYVAAMATHIEEVKIDFAETKMDDHGEKHLAHRSWRGTSNTRTGIIIQARMGSTRFPGKVLADLAGKPMLQQLVERLQRVPNVDELIVATSGRPADDVIEAHCASHGITCFRGSVQDVLQRYADAAVAYDLDVVIRACGDAPLTDPPGIVELMRVFNQGGTRFVHNRHPDGWPAGTAADLMPRDALLEAAAEADQHQREHVVPFLLEHSKRFGMRLVYAPTELHRPDYHLAVDYPDDLALMRRLYAQLGTQPQLDDVIAYLDANSEFC